MIQPFRRRQIILAVVFVLALATALYFAGRLRSASPPQPAGMLAADKGYGVTIDLTRYDDRALVSTLSSLRENSLFWLRQPILWHQIEAAPGQFNWADLDRALVAVEQNNAQAVVQAGDTAPRFKLIVVLFTTPEWARPSHTPAAAPPTHLRDFGRFARALAERYGRQIDHYQIWHEPNLSANWGRTFVDAPAYARLLQEAALNIRDADSEALILTAALAPTLEHGPLNLDETEYLHQLYQIRADRWFDIVAGQPYGFDFDPADPPHPETLNFRRIELLRQVMLNHGDAGTPIWATAFGWNALPAGWSGRPSPWRSDPDRYDSPAVQAERTAAALALARQDWPWLGAILAIRWDSLDLDEQDPAGGFALSETPLLEPFRRAATAPPVATAGRYPATHPTGQYSPGWRTANTLADIPRPEPRTLTIPFAGTRLDLTVNRGPYRGYLWVTIDGQPANALPIDNQGRSYIVLYDPLHQSETVTLAENLEPGPHQAVIEADGGWGQWAVSGWTVYNEPRNRAVQVGLLLAGLVAGLAGLGLVWPLMQRPSPPQPPKGGSKSQIPPSGGLGGPHKISKYLTCPPLKGVIEGGPFTETAQIAVTFALAVAFYLAPQELALILLLPLTLAILYRPDLGLALIAFSLSFFQAPKPLPTGDFLLTETTLLLTVAGFGWRGLVYLMTACRSPLALLTTQVSRLKSLDGAALALVALSFASTLAAPNFGVSMLAWRGLVLGSVVYYFLVRLGRDYGPPATAEGEPPPLRWAWRLLDAFVAGAVLHSMIVLYHYLSADQFVAVEGVRRALSPVYESPNNLSLFLGRVWPILAAVTFLPRQSSSKTSFRRWFYGVGLVIVSLALYLTFSRGALLVGLPAAVIVMALFYLLNRRHLPDRQQRYRRRNIAVTAGALLVLLLAVLPLSQTARFRSIFDLSEGSTGFFRLKLWQASLNMLSDHWLLGVGLNNFLYQYRTRYILPEAWQEPNLSHPHNLVLDFATRLGVGGLVVLVWLQSAFWLNAWRLYQKLPESFVLGLVGSMAVFLSHGLIDNSYFLIDLAFTFFLTVGIVQGLAERRID